MSQESPYTFENPHHSSMAFIPVSLIAVIKIMLFFFARKYKDEKNVDFDKARGFIDSVKAKNPVNTQTGQMPTIGLFPKLKAQAFWTTEDDPYLKKVSDGLNAHFDEILHEYLSVTKEKQITREYSSNKRYGGMKTNTWKGFNLKRIKGMNPEAQSLFPLTSKFIEGLGDRIIMSEFLVLEPGARLPIHTDSSNGIITCQFGLIAEENCALSVAHDAKKTTPKSTLFFDQSFPHTAWNNGSKPRTVLILSMLHPGISDREHQLSLQFARKALLVGQLMAPILLIEFLITRLLNVLRD